MPDRYHVRVSEADDVALQRIAGVGKVSVPALMREAALAYGPVWVANRAADRVAGRPVKSLRAVNGSRDRIAP